MPVSTIGRLCVRLINAFITIALLGFVFVTLARPDLIERLIAWIGTIVQSIGAWNYPIVFISSMVESFPVLGIFVPGQKIMLLVGGFYGPSHLMEIILLAIAGASLGNYIGYTLGRIWGRGFLEAYGDSIGIGRTELSYLERQIERNGAWFIILGKFHSLTRTLVPFVAGSMGMQAQSFWVYNIIGSTIWATVIICLGVLFTEYYHMILRYLPSVVGIAMVCIALYVGFFQREGFMRYWHAKLAEVDEKSKVAG